MSEFLIAAALIIACWLLWPKQSDELGAMTADELRAEVAACHAIGENDAPYLDELTRRGEEV
jgi:hypothetical protein